MIGDLLGRLLLGRLPIGQLFVRRVPPREIVPKGYGIAYLDRKKREAVCVLLPFNWLVGWWRNAVYKLRLGPHDAQIKDIHDEGQRAYKEGSMARVITPASRMASGRH